MILITSKLELVKLKKYIILIPREAGNVPLSTRFIALESITFRATVLKILILSINRNVRSKDIKTSAKTVLFLWNTFKT